MRVRNIPCLLLIAFALMCSQESFAQCKGFTKNKCLPKLKPYIPTEQQYSTTMLNGESIAVRMTFYYGDENRVLICAEEELGKLTLNLKDRNGKTLFTTQSEDTIQWDFNVESTQDMTLEIKTSEKPSDTDLDHAGCVSVFVGFK